jgi:CheY-like chemotaxis protein
VSAALTTLVGIATALGATIVLAGWTAGSTSAARLGAGWRVMVPSTAFGFVCAGLALTVASSVGVERRAGTWTVRALAPATIALPLLPLLEYALGARWFIAQWLMMPSTHGSPVDAYAGRMSAMTSTCLVLLGIALFALAWPGAWSAGAVRHAAGTTLAMSWLALLTVSFDADRISDTPTFPGMAAPTMTPLDIGMPTLNGYEVCKRIREQPWGRQMRIVAQTGWGQTEDRRRSSEAGFDAHLVKPIDPVQLERLLER